MKRKVRAAGWFCALAVMASSSWCADSGAVTTLVADTSSDTMMQSEVKAAFSRFVAGQNSHDASVVSAVLLKSRDFVWAQGGGNSIWGFDEAMAAWRSAWKGSWQLAAGSWQLAAGA